MAQSVIAVTVFDVALEVDVSYSTVSRAINDVPHIRVEPLQKVHQTRERLGYGTNFYERRLTGDGTAGSNMRNRPVGWFPLS